MAEKKAKPASKPASKPIHSTASPYLRPAAEKIKQPHHDTIADRLISLLAPIKQYRADRVTPKGKKGRKRKRHAASRNASESGEKAAVSAPPHILNHLLLGFNNVTRHLETLSALSAPPPPRNPTISSPPPTSNPKPKSIPAIFLLRPLDDLLYAHLPTLSHTASLAYPDEPATRLVLLDQSLEERVAGVAGLRGVSVLALLGNGGAEEVEALVEYVREYVEPVEVGWLRDVREGRWMGTRVETR